MMSNLSWFIYLMGVFENTQIALITMLVFGSIVGFILFLYFLMSIDIDIGIEIKTISKYFKLIKKLIFIYIPLLLFTMLIPSKQTMVLIASNEYATIIMNSPKIKDIVDPSLELLNKYIKNELKKLDEPSTKVK